MDDIYKMKVADLKKELKNRGLSQIGVKSELIERLQSALLGNVDLLDDVNEDALLEDDDGLLDDDLDDEKALLDPPSEEDVLLKTPTSLDSSLNINNSSDIMDSIQKRVTLKRNVSISSSISSDIQKLLSENDENSGVKASNNNNNTIDSEPYEASEKKIIKLSELSTQERLEMRAKKFGAPATSDAKKIARLERFGIKSDENSNSKSQISTLDNPVTVDVLKKRAERFGVSVSSQLTKIENEQKLLKRQERFGGGAAATAATTGTVITAKTAVTAGNVDYAEKARLRLERFKNN